jgi:hypothetical protein
MGGPPRPHTGTAFTVRGMTHLEVMMAKRGNHSGEKRNASAQKAAFAPSLRKLPLPRQRLSSTIIMTIRAQTHPSGKPRHWPRSSPMLLMAIERWCLLGKVKSKKGSARSEARLSARGNALVRDKAVWGYCVDRSRLVDPRPCPTSYKEQSQFVEMAGLGLKSTCWAGSEAYSVEDLLSGIEKRQLGFPLRSSTKTSHPICG